MVSAEDNGWEAEDNLFYIEVQYMFTLDLICIHYLCFRNPPNYDMGYRIFTVPTQHLNACVYTRLPLFIL